MKLSQVRRKASGPGKYTQNLQFRGSGIAVVDRQQGSKGTCNHALAMHETIKDTKGRDRTISYALACTVKHTRWNSRKGQIHKDATGREWM